MEYLLEIGTEEIPARLVRGLASELHDKLVGQLEGAGLSPTDGTESYATTRRLAVLLHGLPQGQPDRTEEALGPPARAAFDEEGHPTKAGAGFARSKGADPSALRRVTTGKGEYAALTVEVKGRSTAEILAESIPVIVGSLYMAASMRWGRGEGPFVRAVRWIVSLMDEDVLPLDLFGLAAGRETRGHRVLGPGPLALESPALYLATLRANGVEPDSAHRQRRIEEGLKDHAEEIASGESQEFSSALIEELVMLMEHPVVVRGDIHPEFLKVPREIIDTSMRYHQKMFSLRNGGGKLLPCFLTVLNNNDPTGSIASGQRQVLEARLHDAAFFWSKDRDRSLAAIAEELPRVVFQQKLGSYSDKVSRMDEVAEALASQLGFDGESLSQLRKSIRLCKVDLCTLTVGEFPELQGVVGSLLAREEGDPPEVQCPIRFQYAPFEYPRDDSTRRFVEALALLDQCDTLMGCHGVGLEASGSKDPYGLRRAAYVIARIVAAGRVGTGMTLDDLLSAVRRSFRTVEGYSGFEAHQKTVALLESRLKFHLQEELQYPYDEINAVFATGCDRPAEVVARLQAVHRLRAAGELDGLSVPLKRIRNILREAEKKQVERFEFASDQLSEDAEKLLAQAGEGAAEIVERHVGQTQYEEALRELAHLKGPVDRFFEEVMVMADDARIRGNRLALLERVRDLFLLVADIGEIVEGSTEQAT